ncbi:MAG: PKD domain-containing protein [Euryarchaeota archaeon]|nr:PKD domain-containing protein [Euryarchaeota archaeon]
MNLEKMAVYVMTAMMAAVIFAALISPASAGAGHIDIYKGTYPDPNAEYVIGETITYELIVTNPNPDCGCTIDVFDMFPNGTEILIADDAHLKKSGLCGDLAKFYTTYVVDAGDIRDDDRVWNRLRIDGIEDNPCGGTLDGSVWASSLINTDITFDFGYVASGCMEATFTGSSTGPVDWHQWDFGDGTSSDVITGAPNAGNAVTHLYATRGDKTAMLYGESVTGKPDNKTLVVHVTGLPTAVAKANGHVGSIQLPVEGMNIIFDGTESSADSPATLDSGKCLWTIDGTAQPAGLGPYTVFIDHSTSASLKVEDDHGCIKYAHVTILGPPAQDVPVMTPAGMLMLIGMLCIIGAGRVIMKGKRL